MTPAPGVWVLSDSDPGWPASGDDHGREVFAPADTPTTGSRCRTQQDTWSALTHGPDMASRQRMVVRVSAGGPVAEAVYRGRSAAGSPTSSGVTGQGPSGWNGSHGLP